MPKNTTLRAYVLSDRTEHNESNEIEYALTARDARRNGYLDNVSWIDLAVRRAPYLDAYAPGPVPLAVLLSLGWWWECHACGNMLHGDSDGIMIHEACRAVFCNELCEALFLVRKPVSRSDASGPRTAGRPL